MKTSFAKTFSDLSKNMESKNELSDEKQTYRKITDENDDSLTDDIYVVESYNENYESKEMSTLLVNRDLTKSLKKLNMLKSPIKSSS